MKKNDIPDVTVLVPTYKRPKWLQESLESILAQKDVNIHLVLLDNGSQCYETKTVCKRMVKEFPSSAYIERFINHASNIGEMHSYLRGSYVVEFTDDDRMLPGNLKLKMEALKKHPECAMAFSPVETIDAEGKRMNFKKGRWNMPHSFGSLLCTSRMVMPSVMFRREVFKMPAFIPPGPGGEWFRHLAIMWDGWQVIQIPRCLVELRIHDGADTEKRGRREGAFIEMHLRAWEYWIGTRNYVPTVEEWKEMFNILSCLASEFYGESDGYLRVLKRLLDLKGKASPSA